MLSESNLAGNINADYVYFAGMRVARRDVPSNVLALTPTSSTTITTDEDVDYYPYGGEIVIGGSSTATRYKFTGKERDGESGLDNLEKRYFGSSLGRFMTPDPIFFQADMLSDPQRFNLYAYVRNNPLSLTDPTGESIELTCSAASGGECEAERQKGLQALKDAVGKEAGSYLYENAVTTTDANGNSTTKYYVGVRDGTGGEASVFGQMNSVAGELAPIIADTKNVQVAVVNAGSIIKDDFGNSYNINARTPAATSIFGGNLRVNILDPSTPILPLDSFMMSNGQLGENTPGMVVGHELGHARGVMTGKLPGETSPDSLRLENKVRTLQNPGAPQRLIHDCPPGVCGSVPK